MGSTDTMGLDLADQISQKASGFIQSSNHRDLLDIGRPPSHTVQSSSGLGTYLVKGSTSNFTS